MKRVMMALLMMLNFTDRVQPQWTLTSGPYGGPVGDIAVAGNTVFATAEGAGMFVSKDNGMSWVTANAGLPSLYLQKVIASGTNVFVGTEEGVFISSNYGTSWIKAGHGLKGYINSFTARGHRIFAATYGGGVWVTEDNGANWKTLASLKNTAWKLAAGSTHLFALTDDGVFVSGDNGLSWSEGKTGLTSYYPNSIVINNKTVFVGSGKGMLVSHDNGSTWIIVSKFSSSVSCYAGQLLPSGHPRIFVKTDEGYYQSDDNGITWNKMASEVPSFNVMQSGAGGLFIATAAGVYHSSDNGIHWAARNKGLLISGVWSITAKENEIYAILNGEVFKSSAATPDWVLINRGVTGGVAQTLLRRGKSEILVGTDRGLFRSDNAGATWTAVKKGLEEQFLVISRLCESDRTLCAGTNRGIFTSADNGQSWIPFNEGLTNKSITALVSRGQDVFAGTENGIFFLSNGETKWKDISTNLPGKFIRTAVLSGPLVVVLLQTGLVYSSADNGQSWTVLKTELGDTGASALACSGNKIYVSSSDGRVLRSEDRGASWTRVGDGLPKTDIRALTTGNGFLYAGPETGGVYRIKE